MELVQAGNVPLRECVQRLANEAVGAGIKLAVCSISNETAVSKIVDMLGDAASSFPVFAGDIVAKMTLSPDVYNLASEKFALNPSNVCVIEDILIGVKAARAAGMLVVVTMSTSTQEEDFKEAQKVLNSLEDRLTSLQDLTDLVASLNSQEVSAPREDDTDPATFDLFENSNKEHLTHVPSL